MFFLRLLAYTILASGTRKVFCSQKSVSHARLARLHLTAHEPQTCVISTHAWLSRVRPSVPRPINVYMMVTYNTHSTARRAALSLQGSSLVMLVLLVEDSILVLRAHQKGDEVFGCVQETRIMCAALYKRRKKHILILWLLVSCRCLQVQAPRDSSKTKAVGL